MFDARVESPNLVRATMRADSSWDLRGLSAKSRVRPGRWSAVLRIPLAEMVGEVNPLTPALSRGEREQALPRLWRANFYRIDRGERDEYSAWSPPLTDPVDFHTAGRFGRLELPAPAPSS